MNPTKLAAAAAACIALAGCAVEGPMGRGSLMADHSLTVQPHPTDPNRVIMHVVLADALSPMTPDRLSAMATGAFADQCGQPTVEDMRVTVAGASPVGIQRRLYSVTVRCPNGATRPLVAAAGR